MLVTRNLINKDRSVMLPVYKTLIRPHLEYCVQLWNPVPEHGNWSLILKLEGIQRRFTRMIDGVGLLPLGRVRARAKESCIQSCALIYKKALFSS